MQVCIFFNNNLRLLTTKENIYSNNHEARFNFSHRFFNLGSQDKVVLIKKKLRYKIMLSLHFDK